MDVHSNYDQSKCFEDLFFCSYSEFVMSIIYACLLRLMIVTSSLCNLIWIEMVANTLLQMQIEVQETFMLFTGNAFLVTHTIYCNIFVWL